MTFATRKINFWWHDQSYIDNIGEYINHIAFWRDPTHCIFIKYCNIGWVVPMRVCTHHFNLELGFSTSFEIPSAFPPQLRNNNTRNIRRWPPLRRGQGGEYDRGIYIWTFLLASHFSANLTNASQSPHQCQHWDENGNVVIKEISCCCFEKLMEFWCILFLLFWNKVKKSWKCEAALLILVLFFFTIIIWQKCIKDLIWNEGLFVYKRTI